MVGVTAISLLNPAGFSLKSGFDCILLFILTVVAFLLYIFWPFFLVALFLRKVLPDAALNHGNDHSISLRITIATSIYRRLEREQHSIPELSGDVSYA